MNALAVAMAPRHRSGRRRRPRHRSHRARHHRLERHSASARTSSRSTTTTSGATTAPGTRPPRSPPPPTSAASRPSIGAAAAYSSEWGFAKLLHWLRHNPESARASPPRSNIATWWPPALCGITDPADVARSVCAMGHKWMWNAALGGLPPEDFLTARRSAARGRARQTRRPLRDLGQDRRPLSRRVGGEARPASAGIPIPVGAFDAHWDAIGAGVRLGDVVNVVGHFHLHHGHRRNSRSWFPASAAWSRAPIHPGCTGIEAGLSATGDIFEAIARRAGTTVAELSRGLEQLSRRRDRPAAPHLGQRRPHRAGESRVGRRHPRLAAHPHRAGRAVRRHRRHRFPHPRHSGAHGGARRADPPRHQRRRHPAAQRCVLNQVYANVLGKPILVPQCDVTSLGSAIFAFLAAGTFRTIEEAQAALCPCLQDHRARAACRRGLSAPLRALSQALLRLRPQAILHRRPSATFCPNCAASPGGAGVLMLLEALRGEVLEANLELVRRGLVIYTFGNCQRHRPRGGPGRHQAQRRSLRQDDRRRTW